MIYVVGKSIGSYGGGAFVAADIVDSLYSSGLDIGTISVGYNVKKDDYSDTVKNAKHIKMPFQPSTSNYSGFLGRLKLLTKKCEYQARKLNLKIQLNLDKPDIFILNDTFYGTRHIFDIHIGKAKSIQMVHVSPTFVKKFFGDYPLEKCLEDYNRADSIVFVSDVCRKEWLSYGAIDHEKANYIPNCAREDEAQRCLEVTKSEMRENLGLNQNSFVLANVSSLMKRKGQDLIIKAAPLLKKIAPDIEIIIVGSGGNRYSDKLKEQAAQMNLDFVHFLGRKSNAMEYIYAADLFLLPSRAEAFPLVILEAMILKTPVVASGIDGTTEMIHHGDTGCIFESDSVDDMVAQFERMYKNRELGNYLASNANDRYWSEFSRELFTNRYVELVKKVSNE